MNNYLRPSFLYPAASAYQLANGIIQRFNHGLFTMYPASDGADMVAKCRRWIEPLGNWDDGPSAILIGIVPREIWALN